MTKRYKTYRHEFATAACHIKIQDHLPNTLGFANVAIADLPTLEREARVVATRNAFIVYTAGLRYESGRSLYRRNERQVRSLSRTSRIKYYI